MADQQGLDELRGRVERRSRSVPPPRRPRELEEGGPRPENETAGPASELDRTDVLAADTVNAEARAPAAPAAETSAQPEAPPTSTRPPATSRSLGPAPESPPVPLDRAPRTVGESAVRSYTATGEEPTANLTLRVRQSLDLRLAELIHELKREGVRSSKKELIEMFLSELPLQPTEDLRVRLRRYRNSVPKEPL